MYLFLDKTSNSMIYATPAFISTGLICLFLKWLGLDKYEIVFTVLLTFTLIVLVSLCGMIQNYFKVRIIPFPIVDICIKYIIGLLSSILAISSIVFSIWFVYQILKFVGFILG